MQIIYNKPELEVRTKQGNFIINGGIYIGSLKIVSPGEYEVGGISIAGSSINGGVILRLLAEGLALVYPINIDEKIAAEALKEIGSADVMVLEKPTEKFIGAIVPQFDPNFLIVKEKGENVKISGEVKDKGSSVKIEKRNLVEGQREAVIFV